MITHLHCYCCSHIFDLHYCCYFLVVLIKYICLYMYVYGCVQIYMNIYMYMYIYIYIYLYIGICIYVCVCMCKYIYVYIFFVVKLDFNQHHETRSASNYWYQRFMMIALKCKIILFGSQIFLSICYCSWKASLISKCQKCSLNFNVK